MRLRAAECKAPGGLGLLLLPLVLGVALTSRELALLIHELARGPEAPPIPPPIPMGTHQQIPYTCLHALELLQW